MPEERAVGTYLWIHLSCVDTVSLDKSLTLVLYAHVLALPSFLPPALRVLVNIVYVFSAILFSQKTKGNVSCEIETFFESHVNKLRVILRPRVQ